MYDAGIDADFDGDLGNVGDVDDDDDFGSNYLSSLREGNLRILKEHNRLQEEQAILKRTLEIYELLDTTGWLPEYHIYLAPHVNDILILNSGKVMKWFPYLSPEARKRVLRAIASWQRHRKPNEEDEKIGRLPPEIINEVLRYLGD